MTRTAWFESPFLLGFERMQELAERVASAASDGYPPYNIEARGEHHLRITLAVAGFEPGDLTAEVDGAELVLSGARRGGDDARTYLHRGIAMRRFRHAFVLADGYEVEAARLENGLLHVDVARPQRTASVRQIPIQWVADMS